MANQITTQVTVGKFRRLQITISEVNDTIDLDAGFNVWTQVDQETGLLDSVTDVHMTTGEKITRVINGKAYEFDEIIEMPVAVYDWIYTILKGHEAGYRPENKYQLPAHVS